MAKGTELFKPYLDGYWICPSSQPISLILSAKE